MAVRKRYYIWLARAYLKRWKKTILLSTVVGIVGFFLVVGIVNYFLAPAVTDNVEKIGITGTYTLDNPPEEIFQHVSFGLTQINENGQILPAAAQNWEIKDDGKRYVFHLKDGQRFHDGTLLTAQNLPLNFQEAKKEVVDEKTVVYTLENEFSPFLTSVARPILNSNLDGLGEYEVTDIELNASFLKSVTLQNTQDSSQKKRYFFYPTEEALKTAYALGEIDTANLSTTAFQNSELSSWDNTKINENVSYDEMVAVFYDNTHEVLSDKRVRQALNLALPQTFAYGERADSPLPPTSQYYQKNANYLEGDIEIARELLDSSAAGENPKFEITATEELEAVAKEIQNSWKRLGITTTLKVVKNQPEEFEMYITKYNIPKDPDQYTLWHSDQTNNITGYKNLRIDKLLEDGRVISDVEERKDIYADFQKYLLDDTPASFLYYPTSFTLTRK